MTDGPGGELRFTYDEIKSILRYLARGFELHRDMVEPDRPSLDIIQLVAVGVYFELGLINLHDLDKANIRGIVQNVAKDLSGQGISVQKMN